MNFVPKWEFISLCVICPNEGLNRSFFLAFNLNQILKGGRQLPVKRYFNMDRLKTKTD